MNKIQCNRFYFNSVRIQSVLRYLVSIANVGQNKKLPEDEFMKQKGTFRKIFHSIRNFLELQCLVDDLVELLELSIFINASLP